MPTVAIVSRKGGVGKSTVTLNLAVAASQQNSVTIVDTDPQASCADWGDRRLESGQTEPSVICCPPARVPGQLGRIQTNWTFIDTQPSAEAGLLEVVGVADYALIIVRPGQPEIDAIGATTQIVRLAEKTAAFVVNQAHPSAGLNEITALLEDRGYPVAPPLRLRADYGTAWITGQGVLEIDSEGKAAAEVATLWAFLEEAIAKRGFRIAHG